MGRSALRLDAIAAVNDRDANAIGWHSECTCDAWERASRFFLGAVRLTIGHNEPEIAGPCMIDAGE